MSVPILFDSSRDVILDRFRGRIDRGDRTNLTREERENLAGLLRQAGSAESAGQG